MDDKLLLEDDIIDLTDLLEEGSPPKKPQAAQPPKKRVTEPDSFDLGKEISMDYDVSIEEIENDSTMPAAEGPLDLDKKLQAERKAADDLSDIMKEPLGGIESEIDNALKDKLDEVSLTAKEEEVLLQEAPLVEEPPLVAEEKAALMEEAPAAKEESMPMKEQPMAEPTAPLPETEPRAAQMDAPRITLPVDMPAEAVLDAVIAEFKKDMPALLEGIVRPVVKELIQEVISSTREALPGIVEKVIKEEIDKLKKI